MFMGRNSSYRKYIFFHTEKNRTVHTEETLIRYKKYDAKIIKRRYRELLKWNIMRR